MRQNLSKVACSPGASDVLSPESATPAGDRSVPDRGNADQLLGVTIKNLQANQTYYWSAHSVDTAFAGSPFPPEETAVLSAGAQEADAWLLY